MCWLLLYIQLFYVFIQDSSLNTNQISLSEKFTVCFGPEQFSLLTLHVTRVTIAWMCKFINFIKFAFLTSKTFWAQNLKIVQIIIMQINIFITSFLIRMADSSGSTALPFLPGYSFNDPTKTQFHRAQGLKYKNGFSIPQTNAIAGNNENKQGSDNTVII